MSASLRSSRVALSVTITLLGWLLAACGSDDEPPIEPVPWEGDWVASEIHAQPLPVCYATNPTPRCVEGVSLELDRDHGGRRSVQYRDNAGVASSLTTTVEWTRLADVADGSGVVLEIIDDRGCTYEGRTDEVPTEGLFMALKDGDSACHDDLVSVAVFRRP